MKVIVIAKTNATRQKIQVLGDHKLKVWVKSQPINGKENKEIIRFLRKIIGKETGTKPKIGIITGATAGTKVLEADCTWSQISVAVKTVANKS